MIRNPTPRNIAFILSAFLSVLVALIGVLTGVYWVYVLASSLVFGIISFVTILYFVKLFIYRKIKLVYKTIHHLKSKGKRDTIFSSSDLLETVKSDVAAWAADQNKTITVLRTQEKYRKEFLANVSHELKTPIFSIQGYIHTLLDGALEDDQITRKFLETAAKNTDQLQEVVEDLMTIRDRKH